MKTRFLTLILSCFLFIPGFTQEKPLRILMIGAHPDDCDIKSGGTAALFSQLGHEVKFLSITNGDAGHMDMGGGMLAVRRNAETQEVARRLGVTYEVLDNHDGELMPTLEIRKDVIRKIREWEADVVISHRTNDYHPDHRYTGVLVQDAAFMVGVPNIAADTPPLKKNPFFLYYQDHFQKPNPFSPDIAIDISSVIDQKIYALDAHVSQFYEWLPWIANDPDEIPKGKEERIQWLKSKRALAPSPSVRAGLEKWYGSEVSDKAQFAEAFEICEYGSQPDEAEIKRLFPMLGNLEK
ncbi:N-acetylglucosaminyl deacetylase, LmbE family [Algoriphagus faecimaris]|uniref:N-acetylglucosaminyl deacetylase, LmbE family n=1 Tax=Algoriphagus faecimaris TaxID=686796 RepID=A0A1G6M6X2_9BACT|nr:PIG-L family deacetylase [Algoriphagus faecimaris]SDC51097.1 N-acetylglucosaminyl deacetylase, LmbE family [Algoriphagus faecimaris]